MKVLADAISIDGMDLQILFGVECGRGGVADDATPMSRQGRGARTGRQWQQGPENGQQAPRRRAERRIGSLKVRRQRLRNFGPRLSIVGSRVDKKRREGKAVRIRESTAVVFFFFFANLAFLTLISAVVKS